MVHSSMSPHLFEQPAQIPLFTPPASPTNQTPCALPKMEACNLLIPGHLRTLHRTSRGTPTHHPISELHLPTQKTLANFPPLTTTSKLYMECGAPAPPLTNQPTPPTSTPRKILNHSAALAHLVYPNINLRFTTHSNPSRDHLGTVRFLLDNRKSSANIPMLSV
jgi:hypothetical protein